MKCINVTFNTVDDAEFAVSALKSEFEFSYSFVSDTENEDAEKYDKDTFVFPSFYNASNLVSPYLPLSSFIQYPMLDTINTDTTAKISDVVLRIKCRDAFSNEIKNRLINLNGRHIRII